MCRKVDKRKTKQKKNKKKTQQKHKKMQTTNFMNINTPEKTKKELNHQINNEFFENRPFFAP